MDKHFYEEQYAALQEEIKRIAESERVPLRQMSGIVAAVGKELDVLRALVVQDGFSDKQDEIFFFKSVKPKFYALKIFYLTRYQVEANLPLGDKDVLKDFYREELRLVQRGFQLSGFLYPYYRLGAVDLDELYFIRGADWRGGLLLPDAPELDVSFSTLGDYVFAKIMAGELLADFLSARLLALDGVRAVNAAVADSPALRWTGDKVNLVEIIYALYFTGQLNDGNADISVIIQFMEKNLKIDLSRTYRDFIDIKNRKVSSPTRFIEKMRDAIHARIDEELSLAADKRRTRLGK